MAARSSDRGSNPAPEAAATPETDSTATFDVLVKEEQTLKERMHSRLNEIMPAVQEAEQIRAWLAEHEEQRSNNANSQTTAAPRQRRTRRGGNARDKFLAVVQAHPEGISVADAAKELGKSPAYFYRIAKDAVTEGAIKRSSTDTRLYQPA